MKKIITLALALVIGTAFAGCNASQLKEAELVDGTYRAEYSEIDSHGWKDFVEVTIEDGQLGEVVYDSENSDGTKLKSEDQGYKTEMENFNGTYPAKYSKDLINQFIESGKATSVDVVAGATESTEHFKVLIVAAMENAIKGNTEIAYVK